MPNNKTHELLDYGTALVKTVREYIPISPNMAKKGGFHETLLNSQDVIKARKNLSLYRKERKRENNFDDFNNWKQPIELKTGNCEELVNACLYIANTNPDSILRSTEDSGAYFTRISFSTDHDCLILHGNRYGCSLFPKIQKFNNIAELCKQLMENQSSDTYPVIVDPWLYCCYSVADLNLYYDAANNYQVKRHVSGKVIIENNTCIAPVKDASDLTYRTLGYHSFFLIVYKMNISIRALNVFTGLLSIFKDHAKEQDILLNVINFYMKNLELLANTSNPPTAPVNSLNMLSYLVMEYIIRLNYEEGKNGGLNVNNIIIDVIEHLKSLDGSYCSVPYQDNENNIRHLFKLYIKNGLSHYNIDKLYKNIISLIRPQEYRQRSQPPSQDRARLVTPTNKLQINPVLEFTTSKQIDHGVPQIQLPKQHFQSLSPAAHTGNSFRHRAKSAIKLPSEQQSFPRQTIHVESQIQPQKQLFQPRSPTAFFQRRNPSAAIKQLSQQQQPPLPGQATHGELQMQQQWQQKGKIRHISKKSNPFSPGETARLDNQQDREHLKKLQQARLKLSQAREAAHKGSQIQKRDLILSPDAHADTFYQQRVQTRQGSPISKQSFEVISKQAASQIRKQGQTLSPDAHIDSQHSPQIQQVSTTHKQFFSGKADQQLKFLADQDSENFKRIQQTSNTVAQIKSKRHRN